MSTPCMYTLYRCFVALVSNDITQIDCTTQYTSTGDLYAQTNYIIRAANISPSSLGGGFV